MTVMARVKRVIQEQLEVKEESVAPGASFVDDLGLRFRDPVELIMALEETLSVALPERLSWKAIAPWPSS